MLRDGRNGKNICYVFKKGLSSQGLNVQDICSTLLFHLCDKAYRVSPQIWLGHSPRYMHSTIYIYHLMCYCLACIHRTQVHMIPSSLYYKPHQIQNLNVSRLVLQLSLPNPLKPCVKSKMKMQLEQRPQATIQLHLRDQQFYWLLRCDLY